MTMHSTNHTQQADTLARQACKMVDNGGNAVARMDNAIRKIENSFDQIAETINAVDQIAFRRNLFALSMIDEIAFQTNLLASDAGVKAARARQVSKGFAVVAEEVRNLATQSAEAAKNIAAIMEESARTGVDITQEVAKALEEVMQSFGKTTGLVAEIAATLQERTENVKQNNGSLTGWVVKTTL